MHQYSTPIDLRIRISGEAGDGILTASDILLLVISHLGYYGSVYKSIPSNIRGGQSLVTITISENDIVSPVSLFDILIISGKTISDADLSALSNCKLVLIDSEILQNSLAKSELDRFKQSEINFLTIDIKKSASNLNKNQSLRSTAILGYLCWILQIPLSLFEEQIRKRLSTKGNDVLEQNLLTINNGYLNAQNDIKPPISPLNQIASADNRIIIDGNQALSIGAIKAGANYYASYPITPATSIGDFLGRYLHEFGGFAYQAEDEIAAIGSAIGASFCGAKAFTATSGPGLSLMQEFIGFASMSELPVVIIDVQRAGPSTGMSTKHAQDDLLASVYGGHGEGQRVILAPTGIHDCIFTTINAFNIAEQYQCPVILLSDASMAMIKQTIKYPDLSSIKTVDRKVLRQWDEQKSFLRYKSDPDNLNPIPIPGISPVSYQVTGLEHTEASIPSVSGENHNLQMKRRAEKILNINKDYPDLLQWDLDSENFYKADFSLIAWGITASIARKSIANMRQKGYKIAALYPRLLFPVLKQDIERLLEFSDKLFVPESNFSGQYSNLIRIYTNAKPVSVTICRDEPFTPEELETYLTVRMQS